jgi:hypothetical protein
VIIAAARARTDRRAPGAGADPREALGPFAARRVRDRRGPPPGVEERKIANVTRHRNLPVLRRYIRQAPAFDDVGEVL